MIREFKNDANTSAANIEGLRSQSEPQRIILDEPIRQDDAATLRSFHVEQDDQGSNNMPKIAGAIVVGLLIIGGGIYAYESTSATQSPLKTVAMKTPAPSNLASTQPAPLPDNTSAAPAPSPATSATPTPPAPRTIPTAKSASLAPAPVEQSASSAEAATTTSTDAAINAPMTLTPETAPPPEQAAQQPSPTQSAMQQPLTAPNVSGSTSQPTPEIANNNSASVVLPSGDQSDQAPAPAQSAPAP